MNKTSVALALIVALSGNVGTAWAATDEAVVLAVMPFKSIGDSVSLNLGESFSETITTKLIGLKGLKVYERAQFDKINAELSFQRDASDMIDQASLAKVGSVVTMDYMILGSVTLAGQKLACQIRLVRVRDGQAVLSKIFEGSYPKGIFEMQDAVALQLADSLKLKLDDLDRKRLAKKPTENLDSWDLYNKSLGSMAAKERIPLLEKALAADPAFTQAAHLLADLYLETSQTEKARKVYASILSKDPTDYRALFNQAMLTFDRGDFYSARDLMEHALLQKDSDPDIYYHLGLFYEFTSSGERLGEGVNVQKCLDYYDRALALDPLHRESLLGAGMLRLVLAQSLEDPEQQLGHMEKAHDGFETFLRIAPDAMEAPEIQNTLVQVDGNIAEFRKYLGKKE